MRQLRFVHTVDDGTQVVVETTDGNEQFALTVDPALRAAVGGGETSLRAAASPAPRPSTSQPSTAQSSSAQPAGASRPDSSALPIPPREIQVRVRAGESPEDLAADLGVDVARIMRFAGPAVEERLRITDEARRARARRSTTEGQTVVFGEAVDERFAAHGITAADIRWDSHRRDDGDWVVVAEWTRADSAHTAEWLFHRTSRSVTPVDDTAADLLSDRPIRPITPTPPDPLRLVSAPPLARGVVAFPPMPEAHTGPLPVFEEVFDQEAAADGPRATAVDVNGDGAPQPASALVDDLIPFDEEPELPLGIPEQAPRPAPGGRRLSSLTNLGVTKRDESDDEKAARARVPSWDDILLGVRRKQD